MNTFSVSVGLPLVLAVIMFGLGLSLTVADFTRIAKTPRVVAIALTCQVIVLPAVAFGLVLLFGLSPVLAVGMLLLAASPGGTTANLFSHLFRGDVALNVSLTAINSVLAVVTVPLVTNLAIDYFDPLGDADAIGLQMGKVIQVFAMVLVPVAVGMLVRRWSAGFALRMERPVRIGSAVALLLVITVAVLGDRGEPDPALAEVGAITMVFCLISLGIGYLVPRLLGIAYRQAVACSMEVGLHNSTIALTIALSVIGSTEMALPAAIYGVVMFPLAAGFGWLITRRTAPDSRGHDAHVPV
ncbi:bile acid:sodium symporter family protein [Nocardia asteroides]|uniref:bile acid:sodium symporter family protein n=1 Tax=Nocardia asteroides TaxID=1824 RepID=UPI0037C78C23